MPRSFEASHKYADVVLEHERTINFASRYFVLGAFRNQPSLPRVPPPPLPPSPQPPKLKSTAPQVFMVALYDLGVGNTLIRD
ncbi:unnamed protein product [Taenia asiatica]|uniref:Uncharacterized protein n=1 Tax=Taenia asiatica TaxID=60517 RepID=A0A0R3VTK4_TAEAS|nr:unnamed protein product [Taenia asiatica]